MIDDLLNDIFDLLRRVLKEVELGKLLRLALKSFLGSLVDTVVLVVQMLDLKKTNARYLLRFF